MSSYELDEIGGHEKPPTVAVREPRLDPQEIRHPVTWRKFSVGISILIVSLLIAILVVLVYYNVNEKSSTADPGNERDIPDPQASTGEKETNDTTSDETPTGEHIFDDQDSEDSTSDDSDSNDGAPNSNNGASEDSESDDNGSNDGAPNNGASEDSESDGSKPRRYNLEVVREIKTDPRNNEEKLIAFMFNETILAPAIHVKNGAWISARVTNSIAYKKDDTANLGLSIHWHGLDMKGAQIFDGVVGLTQCPIMEKRTYDYKWLINEEPGTYWYHQHDRKMFPKGQIDFIRGPFIIHPADSDLDLPSPDTEPQQTYQIGNEIILFFSDIDSHGILNGEKQPKIFVKAGFEYRFRIINGIHSMPSSLRFFIIGQFGDREKGGLVPLTVIATDAYQVEDFEVDAINIAIAERYDVKVTFPNDAGHTNAYIYAYDLAKGKNIAVGVLLIGGGENTVDIPEVGEMTAETRTLNCYNFSESHKMKYGTCIPVTDLTSVKTWNHLDKLDGIKFYDIGDAHGEGFNVDVHGGKFIKNRIPCHALIKRSSKNDFPGGTAIMSLPTNKSVTIMLRVRSNSHKPGGGIHPMHMHGHHYEVLGIANGENNQACKIQPDDDTDSDPAEYYFGETIEELEKRKGVLKDTVILPVCGAVVLRINTDNPGVWFFHCHIDWHLHHGLAAVINEGNYIFSQTKFPSDYPSCQSCEGLR